LGQRCPHQPPHTRRGRRRRPASQQHHCMRLRRLRLLRPDRCPCSLPHGEAPRFAQHPMVDGGPSCTPGSKPHGLTRHSLHPLAFRPMPRRCGRAPLRQRGRQGLRRGPRAPRRPGRRRRPARQLPGPPARRRGRARRPRRRRPGRRPPGRRARRRARSTSAAAAGSAPRPTA